MNFLRLVIKLPFFNNSHSRFKNLSMKWMVLSNVVKELNSVSYFMWVCSWCIFWVSFSFKIASLTHSLHRKQYILLRNLLWQWLRCKNIYVFIFQTESMLKIAEDLGGPYIWGQYDLLVLPPSFPYGGMENPCLTFVTPTLLVSVNFSSPEVEFPSDINLDKKKLRFLIMFFFFLSLFSFM